MRLKYYLKSRQTFLLAIIIISFFLLRYWTGNICLFKCIHLFSVCVCVWVNIFFFHAFNNWWVYVGMNYINLYRLRFIFVFFLSCHFVFCVIIICTFICTFQKNLLKIQLRLSIHWFLIFPSNLSIFILFSVFFFLRNFVLKKEWRGRKGGKGAGRRFFNIKNK